MEILAMEIKSDPQGVGYAVPLASGSDTGIAELLNSRVGRGAAMVQDTLTRDQVALSFHPLLLALHTKSPSLQAKWDRILHTLLSMDSLDTSHVAVQGLCAEAVRDGVMQASDVAKIGSRPGSRAEVLFGVGIVVTAQDVAEALGRP